MKLFVQVNLVLSTLAFLTTLIGAARQPFAPAELFQVFALIAWITWATVLLMR